MRYQLWYHIAKNLKISGSTAAFLYPAPDTVYLLHKVQKLTVGDEPYRNRLDLRYYYCLVYLISIALSLKFSEAGAELLCNCDIFSRAVLCWWHCGDYSAQFTMQQLLPQFIHCMPQYPP